MRASETSEVIFEQCRVPVSQMLGVEGQGFINALQVLDAGRIGIAALAVGLAQGAYEARAAMRSSGDSLVTDWRVPERARQAGRRGDTNRRRTTPHVSRRGDER